MTFRPLLAASIDEESQLKGLSYPLIASPKVDGIRVVCHPERGPSTRSLKRVANEFIRTELDRPGLLHLDGEVCVGANCGEGVFARTTSGVMTHDGQPDYTYWVFDHFAYPNHAYESRLALAREMVELRGDFPKVKMLEHRWVGNPDEVLQAEREYLERGFEGVMLRYPKGPYKFNRSTLKQQILIKMKRFTDAEATVVGFEELLRNQNTQVVDNRGYADRSSHKSGMVPANTLGALKVEHPAFGEFAIGSGLDDSLRATIWADRPAYLGKLVTFKYQAVGTLEKPRIPIFKGFRGAE